MKILGYKTHQKIESYQKDVMNLRTIILNNYPGPRALALTCDDLRSLWLTQVFHRLATQGKSTQVNASWLTNQTKKKKSFFL